MKELVIQLLQSAVAELQNTGVLPVDIDIAVHVERARDKSHGDFASNIAMLLAKPARKNPRELATALIAHLPAHAAIVKVELAGPGFINFFLKSGSQQAVLRDVLAAAANYGRSNIGAGRKVQIEFVSANPTGPLHVGHGRGAAYGATCANLLEAAGYNVQREYYVNDAGRQMDILATSVWLRYLECCGETFTFPSNGYKGEYIGDYARALHAQEARRLHRALDDVLVGIPPDEPLGGDKDTHIDGLIARAKQLLGDDYTQVFNAGLQGILADIRTDLAEFGVQYDCWFSEQSLSVPHDLVTRAIERLQAAGFIEERDGALWFMSTRFGDDKDRVVRRENGATTYFASDIAYHLHKFERGYDEVINIWGSDHHGYIVRVKAALQALGIDPARLVIRLVQFVSLYRGGEPVQMSTRSGSFIPLRELRDEVGCDAARFFYVMRKAEQPMDFDLDLAKSQSKDNPVYYLQYAHARVCSMERKAAAQGVTWSLAEGLAHLDLLVEEGEGALALALARFPEVVQDAATEGEPHQVVNYLRDLAGEFHGWYNSHRILLDDSQLCSARMVLGFAVRQVLANGLALLGVSAPQEM